MINRYLIQLFPHDKFFFSTGKEFGTDNQDYYIKSGFFPQQTGLLGMLRYQLLCQDTTELFVDNKIIGEKEDVANLIGEKSFMIRKGNNAEGEENNNFGRIKNLSPVFLMKGEEKFFPLNLEYQKKEKHWIMREMEIDGEHKLLKDYKAKDGLPDLLANKDLSEIYEYDEFFKSKEQVGIKKNYEGKTNDKAFYLQEFKTFKTKDTCFAFYVDLDIELKETNIVHLGGERQSFQMKVTKIKEIEEKTEDKEKTKDKLEEFFVKEAPEYQSSKNVSKIVLLSDAYFERDEDTYCDFAITKIVDFRCLQSTTDTKNYYNIRKKEKQGVCKSVKVELYTKGSVFYFTDDKKMNDFKDKLKKSEFFKIGYNHFKEIKKQ